MTKKESKSGNLPPKSGNLSPKRQRFVDEYLKDLNATQAAIRAGYSEKSAQTQSSALLLNPMVKKAVDEALAKRAQKVGLSQEA